MWRGFNREMCLESPRADRPGCTTTKAGCSPTARTCATAWMGTAWAASTPAPSAAHASAAWSAAATGSGCTSRWRWRVARSSGTSMPFSCGLLKGFGGQSLMMGDPLGKCSALPPIWRFSWKIWAKDSNNVGLAFFYSWKSCCLFKNKLFFFNIHSQLCQFPVISAAACLTFWTRVEVFPPRRKLKLSFVYRDENGSLHPRIDQHLQPKCKWDLDENNVQRVCFVQIKIIFSKICLRCFCFYIYILRIL